MSCDHLLPHVDNPIPFASVLAFYHHQVHDIQCVVYNGWTCAIAQNAIFSCWFDMPGFVGKLDDAIEPIRIESTGNI